MATRLKSNKKALRTAALIVTVAAAAFALVAMECRNQVNKYCAQRDNDFESDLFIDILFQWNYLLYPEVLEKSGMSVSAEELYLTFDEKTISGVNVDDYHGTELIYNGDSTQIKSEYLSELKDSLAKTDALYTTELGMMMDYCVIDSETGTLLKNTTRNIERLTEGEDSEYAYYLMICYDKNGSISDMRVRGSNAEQFLKNAQLSANNAGSRLLGSRQRVAHYALVNESDVVDTRMTVTQKNPQNATFIYAMTEEQISNISWFAIYQIDEYGSATVKGHIGTSTREVAYENVGIGRCYLLFLVGIAVVVAFLVRHMPQCTADTVGTGCSAEVMFVVMWILSCGLYELIVALVYFVNDLYSFISPIDFLILFGVMFLVFGMWYWWLLSVREIFCGMRAFIRKRSRIYQYGSRIKGLLHRLRSRWRSSMASVDLGKDKKRFLKCLVSLQGLILFLVCASGMISVFWIIVYSLVIYFGLRYYIGKIQLGYRNLLQATHAIAQGKFDNAFEEYFGIFESYKEELCQIQGGFRTAVEEEVKSQRMKTELITNVSHDLKTPLTAIITYTDLLKDEHITDEQRRSYLETLERKSLRLKVLIEDLFEISKASSGNVRLEPVAVDICNLIRQVYLEHEDRMTAVGLEMRFDMPEEKTILQLDSQKTYRIFENLYVNITKYALPNTRVYIQAKVITTAEGQDRAFGEEAPERKIRIELKNISAQELTVNPTDLTERFVRGDASRNSEGSGLGLAIAKSFTELQGGKFSIEIDGDLFKAVIEWRCTAGEENRLN